MSSTKTAAPKIADRELLAAFIHAADQGAPTDHKALTQSLGRPRPDAVKRSLARAQSAGLIDLEPAGAPEETRDALAEELAALAAKDDETPPSAPAAAQAEPGAPGLSLIALDRLHPNPFNPRKSFDSASIDELAESILANGLIQTPGPARPKPGKPGEFEIAAGERRLRAMRRLAEQGKASDKFNPAAPLSIVQRDMSDAEMIMLGLTENADREDPHPLEEAEAFLALRKQREKAGGKDAADQATAEIAEAMGKSRRFAQLRIALAEKLCDTAKAAFREDVISLAQARALAQCAPSFQASAVALIKDGRGYQFRTADNILAQARGDAVPAKNAIFDLAHYKGETWTDPESGELFLADRASATKLQGDAVKARAKELQKTGAQFVHVSGYREDWKYEDTKKSAPAEKLGAHIVFKEDGDLSVAVRWPVIMRDNSLGHDDKAKADKQAKRERVAEAAKEAGEKHTVTPYENRNINAGKAARTTALRQAVAANQRAGAAIAVLAMLEPARMGGGYDRTIKLSIVSPTHDDRDVDAVTPSLFREAVLASDEPVDGLIDLDGKLCIKDRAAAFRTLHTHPELGALLAAATADQVGVWTGQGAGDSAFVQAIAGDLELERADAPIDEAYLKRFSRGTIGMIARRAGHDADALPAKKADAIATLLELEAAREDGARYCPPEYHFGDDLALEADIAALLRGEPSTRETPSIDDAADHAEARGS